VCGLIYKWDPLQRGFHYRFYVIYDLVISVKYEDTYMIVTQRGNGQVFIDAKPVQQARFADRGLRNAVMREAEHGLRFLPHDDKVNLGILFSSIPPLDMEQDNAQVLADIQATNDDLAAQNTRNAQAIANLTAQNDALRAQAAGGNP